MKGGGRSVELEGYIPELERAMETYVPKNRWTEEDVATLKRYYGKVSDTLLAKTLHRTINGIHKYAEGIGISKDRDP